MDVITARKEKGNTAFKEKRYEEALNEYQEALNQVNTLANNSNGANSAADIRMLRCVLESNSSACYLQLSRYTDALDAAERAIELDGTFLKAN